MSEFIDIGREHGEQIMRDMEAALIFRGWDFLGAKYDSRFKNISALYAHEEDTDIHRFSFRMRDGKLAAYSHIHFSPEAFPELLTRYLDPKSGYTLTSHQERLEKIFDRAKVPVDD
jgi:hypothetical protein